MRVPKISWMSPLPENTAAPVAVSNKSHQGPIRVARNSAALPPIARDPRWLIALAEKMPVIDENELPWQHIIPLRVTNTDFHADQRATNLDLRLAGNRPSEAPEFLAMAAGAPTSGPADDAEAQARKLLGGEFWFLENAVDGPLVQGFTVIRAMIRNPGTTGESPLMPRDAKTLLAEVKRRIDLVVAFGTFCNEHLQGNALSSGAVNRLFANSPLFTTVTQVFRNGRAPTLQDVEDLERLTKDYVYRLFVLASPNGVGLDCLKGSKYAGERGLVVLFAMINIFRIFPSNCAFFSMLAYDVIPGFEKDQASQLEEKFSAADWKLLNAFYDEFRHIVEIDEASHAESAELDAQMAEFEDSVKVMEEALGKGSELEFAVEQLMGDPIDE